MAFGYPKAVLATTDRQLAVTHIFSVGFGRPPAMLAKTDRQAERC